VATLFPNLKGGTITDNPLAIGATTINSAGFANLPAVTAPDFLWLTLDPDALVGAPEIVKVTAHTASATSVTVTRGQQSTTARSHNLAEVWNAVLTEQDLALVNSPDWTAFTPAVNWTGGGVTKGGRYQKIGKTIFFHLRLNWSSLAVGSDPLEISGFPYSFTTGSTVRHAFSTYIAVEDGPNVLRGASTAVPSSSTVVMVVNPWRAENFVAGNASFLQPSISLPNGSGGSDVYRVGEVSISGSYETT